MVEFIKLFWQSFWNNPKRIIRYSNRAVVCIIIFAIAASVIILPNQRRQSYQKYGEQYAFPDRNGKDVYSQNYQKASSFAKNYMKMNNQEKEKAQQTVSYNDTLLVHMAANPTMKESVPDETTKAILNSLDRNSIGKDEYKYLRKNVLLTSGTLKYIYEHNLAKTFNSPATITFNEYKGTLYISNGNEKTKLIEERAAELFKCSELSKRIKQLTINTDQN